MKTVKFSAPTGAKTGKMGEILGLFSEFQTVNGVLAISPLPRAINPKTKQPSLYQQLALTMADGGRGYINLSQGLSEEWADGLLELGHLQNCNVVERLMQQKDRNTGELLFEADGTTPKTEAVYFIHRPVGSLTVTTKVADIVAKEYVAVAKKRIVVGDSFEQLVASVMAKSNAASVPTTEAAGA